jgi:hypothetical protein
MRTKTDIGKDEIAATLSPACGEQQQHNHKCYARAGKTQQGAAVVNEAIGKFL